MSTTTPDLQTAATAARTRLDAHVREIMQWHFDPATGSDFWLDWAQRAGWDPRAEVKTYDDLERFGNFQDEWLRGGPVRQAGCRRPTQDKPIYTV